MSKTEAERKREARQREKIAQAAKLLDPSTGEVFKRSDFARFLGDRDLALHENLDAFGVDVRADLSKPVQDFRSQYQRDEPLTSLECAVGLVDTFVDAANELAHLINEFKLVEIERAIDTAVAEARELPRDDVQAVTLAYARIAQLQAVRTDLRKPTRHTIPAIRSKRE